MGLRDRPPERPPQGSADPALTARLDARYRGPLMSFFLRRVRDRGEAEDLTQEVFVRMVASAEVDRLENPDAFVFKVAANLLRDRGRKALRHRDDAGPIDPALIGELVRDLVEERAPERVLLGRERLSDVLRTLGDLGDRTRDIFILFRLENMKQREIAALYGIGQSTVEKHVMRAVLHLANRYGSVKS
jgi:RNA polymerase sigma factor (sigma-70 family)